MDITFWQMFALVVTLVLVLGTFSLGGVFLGGMFVFRTKRESYEPIVSMWKPQGDAYVREQGSTEEDVPEFWGIPDKYPPQPEKPPVSDVIQETQKRWNEQTYGTNLDDMKEQFGLKETPDA